VLTVVSTTVREADPGAGLDPLRARAPAHGAADTRGARNPQQVRAVVGRDLAAGEPRRLPRGCFTNDIALIRESLLDVVIEPQRQVLIPGFVDVKQAALAAGALGGSISGAGPTVFAWVDEADAEKVRAGMVEAFARHGLDSDSWVSTFDRAGARVVGD